MILTSKSFQPILQILKLHEEELKERRETKARPVIQRFVYRWWKWLLIEKDNIQHSDYSAYIYENYRTFWSSYIYEQYRTFHEEQEAGLIEYMGRIEQRY
jgi:hypothetical protein